MTYAELELIKEQYPNNPTEALNHVARRDDRQRMIDMYLKI